MIYIVTGYPRSGTSMMMEALENGGMEVAFDVKRDKINIVCGDKWFNVNPGSLREINPNEYKDINFPSEKYEGKLIKIFNTYGILNLKSHDYKIVVVIRKPEHIKESWERMINRPWPYRVEQYYPIMNKVIKILDVRQDVNYKIVYFEKIRKNPLVYFKDLQKLKWPIEAQKCIKDIKVKWRCDM